jgi:4a-hydroxytetrahydrobiopterin dehydratase
MTAPTCDLTQKKCVPCEGGAKPLSRPEAEQLLREVPGWSLIQDGKGIRRAWVCKDFDTALKFINDVGKIADAEDHHPDLHLTGYRNVVIELSTHAIHGLSENDFILAAKINKVPVMLKT